GGVTRPLQHVADSQAAGAPQFRGQQLSLVKPALALSRRMQRDGNDEIKAPGGEARIFQRLCQPTPEQAAQMDLAPIFESMNHFARYAPTSVGGNRCFEMQEAIRAICAGKRARDRPGERLRTLRAERRFNPQCLLRATQAETLLRPNRSRTDRAEGRTNKTHESAEGVGERERRHVSPRGASAPNWRARE